MAKIEGSLIYHWDDDTVHFIDNAAIDNDGSDNRQHDPYWQPDTSLHYKGLPIDSEEVPFIVVPPIILFRTRGIVLGCQAYVTHLLSHKPALAVVADVGPKKKVGEMSPECARRLGINPSAISGGEDQIVIDYKIFPNRPAIVDNITYTLQPYHA